MEDFLKSIVDSFTNSKELEQFSDLIGISEDQYVKEKVFRLKYKELFGLIDQHVQIPTQ